MRQDAIETWEAHRGGGDPDLGIPESSPIGFHHAWMLGAAPEADVVATRDGRLVSLHDGTLDRTGRHVPPALRRRPVGTMDFAELRRCDIGNDAYPGQVVPVIDELLDRLAGDPAKCIVIDHKNAPLDGLAATIRARGVDRQVVFASANEEVLAAFGRFAPDVVRKRWFGGSRERIMASFRASAAAGFPELAQAQLHLHDDGPDDAKIDGWRYTLTPDDLAEALSATRAAGVLLQVLPWRFERADLFALLDLGLRSFAVDYPQRFALDCAAYFAVRGWPAPASGEEKEIVS